MAVIVFCRVFWWFQSELVSTSPAMSTLSSIIRDAMSRCLFLNPFVFCKSMRHRLVCGAMESPNGTSCVWFGITCWGWVVVCAGMCAGVLFSGVGVIWS